MAIQLKCGSNVPINEKINVQWELYVYQVSTGWFVKVNVLNVSYRMLSFFLSNHLKVTTQKIVKSVHINFPFCVRTTSLAFRIIIMYFCINFIPVLP